MTPLERLRYHVSGAIERGERMAIEELTLEGMTQAKWDSLTQSQRNALRSDAGLTPQLKGLEGCRVEVVTTYGETRRFIVGRSTGWVPCHLEVHNRRSHGGPSAEREYASVRVIKHNARG